MKFSQATSRFVVQPCGKRKLLLDEEQGLGTCRQRPPYVLAVNGSFFHQCLVPQAISGGKGEKKEGVSFVSVITGTLADSFNDLCFFFLTM
jgi:hypothetical protein